MQHYSLEKKSFCFCFAFTFENISRTSKLSTICPPLHATAIERMLGVGAREEIAGKENQQILIRWCGHRQNLSEADDASGKAGVWGHVNIPRGWVQLICSRVMTSQRRSLCHSEVEPYQCQTLRRTGDIREDREGIINKADMTSGQVISLSSLSPSLDISHPPSPLPFTCQSSAFITCLIYETFPRMCELALNKLALMKLLLSLTHISIRQTSTPFGPSTPVCNLQYIIQSFFSPVIQLSLIENASRS